MGKEQDAKYQQRTRRGPRPGQERLAELDEERKRLERALAELGGEQSSAASRARSSAWKQAADQRPARALQPRTPTPSPQRHPRRPGGGAGRGNPGISASEIAKTDENQAELSLPGLGDLEKEGGSRRRGASTTPAA